MTNSEIYEIYQKQGSMRATSDYLKTVGIDMSRQTVHKYVKQYIEERGLPPLPKRNARRTKATPDKDWLYHKLHVEHVPMSDFETFGASASTVSRWCDRLGIDHPDRWTTRRNGEVFPAPDPAQAAELYAKAGNTRKLGEMIGWSRETTRRWLIQQEVVLNPRGFQPRTDETHAV